MQNITCKKYSSITILFLVGNWRQTPFVLTKKMFSWSRLLTNMSYNIRDYQTFLDTTIKPKYTYKGCSFQRGNTANTPFQQFSMVSWGCPCTIQSTSRNTKICWSCKWGPIIITSWVRLSFLHPGKCTSCRSKGESRAQNFAECQGGKWKSTSSEVLGDHLA